MKELIIFIIPYSVVHFDLNIHFGFSIIFKDVQFVSQAQSFLHILYMQLCVSAIYLYFWKQLENLNFKFQQLFDELSYFF